MRATLPVDPVGSGAHPRRAISQFLNSLNAISYAEAKQKFGSHGLGLILRVAEPLLHIAVLALWHYLNRVVPIYGASKVLFISSGIYPTFVVVHLSHQFSNVIGRNRWFPGIDALDIIIVRGATILFTYLLLGLALFGGIAWLITPQAIPQAWGPVIGSVCCLACMGYGVGILNAVIEEFVPAWHFVWGGIARAGILFSGVLYVPDFLPLFLRSALQWNPVLQGVELFRYGFYKQYPDIIFMPNYLVLVSVFALAGGLCLERASKSAVGRFQLLKI